MTNATVRLDRERVLFLMTFLEHRNESEITLLELLKNPELHSEIWREIYHLLTGDRPETKSERKFGQMIDRYMDGKI